MKILIDTDQKTIKLEGSVEFRKLAKFVEDNSLEDYSILPDVITVKDTEFIPYYPYLYQWNPYPLNPPYPGVWPTITVKTSDNVEIGKGVVAGHKDHTIYLAELN